MSAYASAIMSFGFTTLVEPISKDLGWSYAQISFGASIRGMANAILIPLIGILIDRVGPRRLIPVGAAIAGLGMLLLSRVKSLSAFDGAFILIAVGMSSSSGLILSTLVGNWFKKKLSLAAGIAACGGAFGGLLVPLVTHVVDAMGWRGAMVVFAIGAWCIVFPLSFVLRHKPEQYGLLPDGNDGRAIGSNKGRNAVKNIEENMPIGRALKSWAFWSISLGCMFHSLASAAVLTHVMPYLSSISIPRSTSSLVTSGLALAGIVGSISFGWFGDRHNRKWVMVVSLIVTLSGVVLLSSVAALGDWLLIPFFVIFGVGWGGCIPLQPALLVTYFGRTRLGTILGLSLGVTMFGAILGPPLAGWVFDSFHSYQGAWFTFIGALFMGTLVLIIAPSVTRPLYIIRNSKN